MELKRLSPLNLEDCITFIDLLVPIYSFIHSCDINNKKVGSIKYATYLGGKEIYSTSPSVLIYFSTILANWSLYLYKSSMELI